MDHCNYVLASQQISPFSRTCKSIFFSPHTEKSEAPPNLRRKFFLVSQKTSKLLQSPPGYKDRQVHTWGYENALKGTKREEKRGNFVDRSSPSEKRSSFYRSNLITASEQKRGQKFRHVLPRLLLSTPSSPDHERKRVKMENGSQTNFFFLVGLCFVSSRTRI